MNGMELPSKPYDFDNHTFIMGVIDIYTMWLMYLAYLALHGDKQAAKLLVVGEITIQCSDDSMYFDYKDYA